MSTSEQENEAANPSSNNMSKTITKEVLRDHTHNDDNSSRQGMSGSTKEERGVAIEEEIQSTERHAERLFDEKEEVPCTTIIDDK